VPRRLLLTVLWALLAAWPAGAQAPRRAGEAGVTVLLPRGWHAAPPDQGSITNPLTRIVAASAPIRWDLTSACQTQVADYAFPATAVAIVVVEWTRPLGGLKIGAGPRRPHRFTAANLPLRRPPAIECFDGPGGSIQFAARGRSFAAYVLLGRRAPRHLADRARAVLDTLRVAPR
jgi:hypothetical protein